MKEVIFFTDGQLLSHAELSLHKIPKDLLLNNKINFVGIVVSKKKYYLSMPKHLRDSYNITLIENDRICRLVINVLAKYWQSFSYSNNNDDFSNNLPIKSITTIIDYYQKFGIFKNNIRKETREYSGNIKWNKTINKTQTIISNGNFIFLPFITNKSDNEYNYVSEAMQYTIDYIVKELGLIFKIQKMYDIPYNSNHFDDAEVVLINLKNLKTTLFKDIDLRLINGLIDFFEHRANNKEDYRLITTNFERVWENMISIYLNKNFEGMFDDTFLFQDNIDKVVFRIFSEVIDDQCNFDQRSMIIDHFAETNDTIYIFDSKYYFFVSDLNYKQVAYHYFIKDIYKNSNKRLINALVLPTSKSKIQSRCHIDRRNRDGLYIYELYVPIRVVMENYIAE